MTVLGVDGGGTRTHAVVVDGGGSVRGFGVGGPSSWEIVGYEKAATALRSAVRDALAEAGVAASAIEGSVFGLAGVDFPSDEEMMGGVHGALGLGGPFRILNDSFVALRAGTNQPWGIVVVAGTGCVVAGRNAAGETFRTLGAGPMFGDDASATEISEAAVSAVAAEYLGRGPHTALSERLCAATDSATPLAFLEGVARERIDPATFASLVVETAEGGDLAARRILEQAGATLGDLAGFVARRLRMDGSEFELVLAGHMFRTDSRILRSAFEATVKRSARFAMPVRLEPPPVVGAALLALELVDVPTHPDLHLALAVASIQAMQAAQGRTHDA